MVTVVEVSCYHGEGGCVHRGPRLCGRPKVCYHGHDGLWPIRSLICRRPRPALLAMDEMTLRKMRWRAEVKPAAGGKSSQLYVL